MICIELAEIVMQIDNRYDYTERLCRDYLTDKQPELFLSVTEEEIAAEDDGRRFPMGYLESVALYRKISEAILDRDGFLLHAAVLEVDGQAYAFSANSGTGKTTHIKLWGELFGDRCRVINGDKPLLRVRDGVVRIYGTPWSGKEGWNTNTSAPLKALCFLERSAENRIVRLSDGEALPLLFGQLAMPVEESAAMRLLDSLDRLLCTVPCYRLGCNMEPEAAQVAYDAMK
ncbi:MAG: hypothetical protein IIX68_02395 [Clostridia bacterium]|nr:hypothetical protein [Clostridia bacterium]